MKLIQLKPPCDATPARAPILKRFNIVTPSIQCNLWFLVDSMRNPTFESFLSSPPSRAQKVMNPSQWFPLHPAPIRCTFCANVYFIANSFWQSLNVTVSFAIYQSSRALSHSLPSCAFNKNATEPLLDISWENWKIIYFLGKSINLREFLKRSSSVPAFAATLLRVHSAKLLRNLRETS